MITEEKGFIAPTKKIPHPVDTESLDRWRAGGFCLGGASKQIGGEGGKKKG